jgi:hypothetical protein
VDGEELVRELRWDVAVPMEHGIVGCGAAKVVDDGEQDCSRVVAMVAERRRS